MFGSVVEVAGAIRFRDSLAVSDVPCAMVLVKIAILITEICFHNCPICGLRPFAIWRNKFRAN
jgi:hypothetical protein